MKMYLARDKKSNKVWIYEDEPIRDHIDGCWRSLKYYRMAEVTNLLHLFPKAAIPEADDTKPREVEIAILKPKRSEDEIILPWYKEPIVIGLMIIGIFAIYTALYLTFSR